VSQHVAFPLVRAQVMQASRGGLEWSSFARKYSSALSQSNSVSNEGAPHLRQLLLGSRQNGDSMQSTELAERPRFTATGMSSHTEARRVPSSDEQETPTQPLPVEFDRARNTLQTARMMDTQLGNTRVYRHVRRLPTPGTRVEGIMPVWHEGCLYNAHTTAGAHKSAGVLLRGQSREDNAPAPPSQAADIRLSRLNHPQRSSAACRSYLAGPHCCVLWERCRHARRVRLWHPRRHGRDDAAAGAPAPHI
jgi:hypothetical protein